MYASNVYKINYNSQPQVSDIPRGVNCPSILHNHTITCSAVRLDLV
ncbi:hypothetical protein NC651_022195 [Populus alba x Populus x berolinensis]|nr:hypothetical protein NC651_022195 [Populus alba x Populus x berolinensis]